MKCTTGSLGMAATPANKLNALTISPLVLEGCLVKDMQTKSLNCELLVEDIHAKLSRLGELVGVSSDLVEDVDKSGSGLDVLVRVHSYAMRYFTTGLYRLRARFVGNDLNCDVRDRTNTHEEFIEAKENLKAAITAFIASESGSGYLDDNSRDRLLDLVGSIKTTPTTFDENLVDLHNTYRVVAYSLQELINQMVYWNTGAMSDSTEYGIQ